MHMADALISPAVGGVMWAATLGTAAYSVKKIKDEVDGKKLPLMGVLAAFVFAAQMINFSIPGTGSSGHLGGGLLLSIILGPYAGFLSMASVLIIQALFFADGGILAYGCNVFNLGFFTCFVAYPFIYRKLAPDASSPARKSWAAIVAAVAGLQMGAFGVVLETLFSGKTELPFGTFVLLMQPIHLAIGLVEGIVTAAIVVFVAKTEPAILEISAARESASGARTGRVIAVLGVCALIAGGLMSWFASSYPDGLEWSMEKVAGTSELEASGPVYEGAAELQKATAFMPDYSFKAVSPSAEVEAEQASASDTKAWPAVDGGTSLAGILGGIMTLAAAAAAGFIIRLAKRRTSRAEAGSA
jgi:cobalt/nickel transport system permease protein